MKSQIVVSRPRPNNLGAITLVYHEQKPEVNAIWNAIVLDTPSDVPSTELKLSLHIDRILVASNGMLIVWITPGPNMKLLGVEIARRLFVTPLDWTYTISQIEANSDSSMPMCRGSANRCPNRAVDRRNEYCSRHQP